MKQHGFLDKMEADSSPLDGHWETDNGLTVVIEGKLLRWSGKRASRLRFTDNDRTACETRLYGEKACGHLVLPALDPTATKTLSWDNGDVWHSYDGRVIEQDTLFLQQMTKTLQDECQDEKQRECATAALQAVSRQ